MKQIPLAPEADKTVQRKARCKVNNEVKAGKFPSIRTRRCELCDAQAEIYHHESYDVRDWLKVVPLCMSCHRFIHSSKREHFLEARVMSLRRKMANFYNSSWMSTESKDRLISECEHRIHFLHAG